jgi:AraC family transcriptional regulator
MPNSERICQAVAFIEDNLRQAITVVDMAEAVSYSLYHFCRVFNEATHHTPFDYLMRRRLSEAALELLQTDKKIIEVALDFQFNHPETFSRAFKRMFDMQPTQLRKEGSIGRQRLMPRLSVAHLEGISTGRAPRPELEQKDAFQLLGLTTLVKKDRSAIREIWPLLMQELGRLEDPFGPADFYGVTWYPQGREDHSFLYMASVTITDVSTKGTALVLKSIPPLRYAAFVHQGPPWGFALDYVYHTWLPRSGYAHIQPFFLERYGKDFGEIDSERDVCIPVE